jgi:competence/damage-inducible protein CinA-like protein
LSRPRTAVLVTGTELVRGDRTDLNGPFLAQELFARGMEATRVTIVGDREEELADALAEGLRADLLIVSGGLGPTHDDRTVELLARAAGRRLVVDPALEQEIESVSRRIADRLRRPYGEFVPGVTKQASVPEGAISLGLAGTAPGVVLDTGSCVAVALPGPPNELRRLWAMAVASEPVRRVLAQAELPPRRTLRFYGVSESAVARVLAEAGGEQGGVEATICARDFEIHVDLVGEGEELASVLRRELSEYLFSEDERPVAELVLERCRERGLTLATAESATGGLVAELITAVPGSSDVFLGAIVAYANEVKVEQLGVSAEAIAEHGAVSAEVARAMADGARNRLGADVAVADTGVAGPGGGTPEKPVGTVYIEARGPEGGRGIHFALPGDRPVVRRRAAVACLHLVRQILDTDR